ncbi:hypothetical protein BJX65DRAFT_302115 [Aspergillus insuetus]
MRYILPVVILGASAVVADTFEDYFNDNLPECIRSCAVKAVESASGCSISDNDCLCSTQAPSGSDDPTALLESLVTDLGNCALNSSCELSDLEGLADMDPSALQSQVEGICAGSSSSSSSSSDDTSDDTSSSDDSTNSSSNNSNSSSDDSSSNSNSNTSNDSSDETADDSTPAQDSEDDGDGAMTLSGSTAILAAGAMMVLAAF